MHTNAKARTLNSQLTFHYYETAELGIVQQKEYKVPREKTRFQFLVPFLLL